MIKNLPIWRKENGDIISCTEKIKVMRENFEEIYQMLQDSYEDAILMDVDYNQVKQFLHVMIDSLNNPYKDS